MDKQITITEEQYIEALARTLQHEVFNEITHKEPMMFMLLTHFGKAIMDEIKNSQNKEEETNGCN